MKMKTTKWTQMLLLLELLLLLLHLFASLLLQWFKQMQQQQKQQLQQQHLCWFHCFLSLWLILIDFCRFWLIWVGFRASILGLIFVDFVWFHLIWVEFFLDSILTSGFVLSNVTCVKSMSIFFWNVILSQIKFCRFKMVWGHVVLGWYILSPS